MTYTQCTYVISEQVQFEISVSTTKGRTTHGTEHILMGLFTTEGMVPRGDLGRNPPPTSLMIPFGIDTCLVVRHPNMQSRGGVEKMTEE